MASAKQIAWRKKFARMAKAGKFRKKIKGSRTLSGKRRIDDIDASFPSPKKSNPKTEKLIYGKTPDYHRKKLRELGYTERTINKFLRSHGKGRSFGTRSI